MLKAPTHRLRTYHFRIQHAAVATGWHFSRQADTREHPMVESREACGEVRRP
jgi:hypothetical protein